MWSVLTATSAGAAWQLGAVGRHALGGHAAGTPAGDLLAVAAWTCALLLLRVAACALSAALSLTVALVTRGAGHVPGAAAIDGTAALGLANALASAARVLSPRVLRPLLAVTLSAGAGLPVVGPAAASAPVPTASLAAVSAPAHRDRPAGAASPAPARPGAPLPAAGWVAAGWVAAPARGAAHQPADVHLVSPAARARTPAEHERLVVRRGDTLWSLAARHLGPDASDAEVAAAWPRWWAANRRVIGDDPDLLHPGTVLLAPPAVRR